MESTLVTSKITLKIGKSWVAYNHLEIMMWFGWIIINKDGHILTRNFSKEGHI